MLVKAAAGTVSIQWTMIRKFIFKLTASTPRAIPTPLYPGCGSRARCHDKPHVPGPIKSKDKTSNQHVRFRGLSSISGMNCRIYLIGSRDGILYKPGCFAFLKWPYHEKFLKSIIIPIENIAANTYRFPILLRETKNRRSK